MNPKYRPLYLLLGIAGLFLLFYYGLTTFPDVNPINILCITVPDMLFVYLAYKTYPDTKQKRARFASTELVAAEVEVSQARY